MIKLTNLNGEEFVLNCDFIETIESKPDTVIKLFNDKKYIVKESIDEVIARVVEYKKRIFSSVPKIPYEEGE
ncbi:flagellar FlbD family protein [Mesoaciditoga lauensis]|uniref:flagellar FlbD family protein n=1 Tax=Mesoaciditoga lauensis TaxID=1495039 RepID=UPI0005647928|nr:flagellar FlbD family protein [Mesoaciditoga lauensis]